MRKMLVLAPVLAVFVLVAMFATFPASTEGTPTPVCRRVLVNGRPQEVCSEAPQELPTETQTVVVVTRTTTATATVTQPPATPTATVIVPVIIVTPTSTTVQPAATPVLPTATSTETDARRLEWESGVTEVLNGTVKLFEELIVGIDTNNQQLDRKILTVWGVTRALLVVCILLSGVCLSLFLVVVALWRKVMGLR